MTHLFEVTLLIFLVLFALSTSLSKDIFTSVLLFMPFTLIMATIWVILRSPDLAITEATVGACISSILFFLTLDKIGALDVFKNSALKSLKKLKNWVNGTPNPEEIKVKKPSEKVMMEKTKINIHGSSLNTLFKSISAVCMLIFVFAMLMMVSQMPPHGSAENPAVNEVVERYSEKGLEETGAVNIVAGMILDYRAFDTFGESTMLFTASIAVIFLLKGDSSKNKEEQLK